MILQKIYEIVREKTGVDIKLEKTRHWDIIDAKRIYTIISRKKTPLTTSYIARFINVHRCNIMHYSKTSKNLLKFNKEFRHLYEVCLTEVDNLSDIDAMLFNTTLIEMKRHYKKYKYYLTEVNKLIEKDNHDGF